MTDDVRRYVRNYYTYSYIKVLYFTYSREKALTIPDGLGLS